MIFVTVGNSRNPFVRLLEAADAAAQRLDEEMVLQSGHTPYRARYARQVTFLDLDAFDRLLEQARIVVAHGGSGSVLSALRLGKPLIVMPRRGELGEHVNDHQRELAEALAREGRLVVVHTAEELQQALSHPPPAAAAETRTPPLLHALQSWFDPWKRARGW